MADEYEPLGPADNSVAPPPEPPGSSGYDSKELKSVTGQTATGTSGARSIIRSRATKNEGEKSKSKSIAKGADKKKKSEKKKDDKSNSSSKSGKDNSDKNKKKNKKLLFCMIGLGLLFLACLIFTIIVAGHAWMGFSFVSAFTVDNGESGEEANKNTTTTTTTTIAPE